MKSNESHDVARKPVDLSSATDEASVHGDNELHENKRRRLIRGAVACAPLVLTLRSGASAAASCTGVKALNVSIGNNGKPPGEIGAVEGDVCYPMTAVNTCPTDTSKLENHVGAPIGYRIDSNGKCGTLQNTTVAIVSSAAAQSFVV